MKAQRSKNAPPRLGEMLLESFCSYDFLSTALWDLAEIHSNNVEKKGKFRADLRYVLDALGVVFHLYFEGKSHYAPNRIAMLKNNFIISFRNLKKDKIYSLINTIGLTMGLSAFILISLFVSHELSYDKFHEDHESTYRLSYQRNEKMGTFEFARTTSLSIPPLLKDQIPEIESYTRIIKKGETIVKLEDQLFYESGGYYVEDSFFEFFNFPIVTGSLDGVLDDPEAILITESMARKYFGGENPMGKVLTLNKKDLFKVVAILQDPPKNTQFQFQFLLSLPALEKRQAGAWSRASGYAYFKIDPDQKEAILTKIEQVKNEFFPENYTDKRYEERGLPPSSYHLQALTDIHLQSRIESEISATGDIRYIYIFSAVGLVILIIACVNYTNAAMARSITRTKEVGIRKAIGANKSALVKLYLSETFLYVLISVMLAVILINSVLPYYNQLINKDISLMNMSVDFALLVSGIILLVSFLSGIYPAFVLSRVSVVGALKGKSPKSRGSRLKKGLITFQFLIAQVLIIVTVIIQSQLSYLQSTNIGYDREQLIYIPIRGELSQSYAAFKNEVNALPNVLNSAYVYNLFAHGDMTAFPMNHFEGLEDQTDEMVWANFYQVGEGFIETMGIKIAEGTDFESNDQNGFIINQALARKLNWPDPVGKVVKPQQGSHEHVLPTPIVGVVRDFNDQTLKSEIKPMMMITQHDSTTKNYLIARLSPQNMSSTLSSIEEVWESHVNDRPFDFTFYDDKFNRQYNAELRQGKMFWVFAVLAIGISILGIMGLSSFMVEQRMKEFSIRKVLGASLRQVMMIVNKGFFWPIILAFVVAAPLAYYWARDQWLQSFVYRIEIQPWYFILAVTGTLLLTVLTVSYHSIKLKKTNPTTYLSSE